MISTHILDLNLGCPAKGVTVILEMLAPSGWTPLKSDVTNEDGRIAFENAPDSGDYRLTFKVENYFQKLNLKPFFKEIPVGFEIADTTRKYHVPLLLSPFGYSTYRGS